MNTRINYMYRDGDNYKFHYASIVSGEISKEQIKTIISCLDDGEYFIPELVGLPCDYADGYDYDEQSDHPFCELDESCFEATEQEDTVDMTVQDADLSLARKKNETVRIRSKRDGVSLVGHVVAPPDPERVVIAAHGWRSSWTEAFGLLAEFLEGSGCAVVYIEQRGQNNSGGETMGFGLLERYDCVDWANWAEARWPEVPIYLYGISQGATSVLLSAELGLPERVHGLIADCGFTSPKEMWEHFAGETMRLGPLTPFVSALANRCFSRILPGFDAGTSTTEALRNCGVPVLFLHGLEDRFVPAEMTMRNFAACAAPKKLLLVEGADHGMCCFTGKEALGKALCEFWEEYDG